LKQQNCVCEICGSSENRPLFEGGDIRYWVHPERKFQVVQCSKCGLAYLNPRPAAEAIGEYYPEDDYWALLSDDVQGDVKPEAVHESLKEIVSEVSRQFPQPASLLDVGCGGGLLIKTFRALGWDVAGIDPSPKVVSVLKEKFGLRVECAYAENPPPMGKFKLVSLNNVLEHLHHPSAALKTIRTELLADDGLLMIIVPNFGSLQARYFKNLWNGCDLPRHLYQFTEQSLGKLLESNGFSIVRQARGVSIEDYADIRFTFRMRFYGSYHLPEDHKKVSSPLKRAKNRLLLSAAKRATLVTAAMLPSLHSTASLFVFAKPQ
jgi:SAM-dependent methyltransferase